MLELQHSEQVLCLAKPRTRARYLCYALLAFTLLIFSAIRWRLRDMPLQRDEGEYAYAGQLLLQGIPLYQHVHSMKFPGTFVANAVILLIFGQTPSGIHIGLLVLNAATALFLLMVGLRVFETSSAVFAAMSYILLSTSRSVLGFQAHATHFVVFFAVAGIVLLLDGLRRNSAWILLTAGLLFGLGILMKQHGIFFLAFAVFYILMREHRMPAPERSVLKKIAALALGAALPLALTFFLVLRFGDFGKFWFWTFKYAHAYTATQTWSYARHIFSAKARSLTHSLELMWIMSFVGLTSFFWDAASRTKADFLLSLTLFSCLAVCPGFLFRGHYFVLMLPAVALLIGLAVSSTTRWFSTRATAGSGPAHLIVLLPGVIFLLTFSYSVFRERQLLFHTDSLTVSREFFALPEAEAAADFIQHHSHPDARVAVLGSEPEIYFYSHRLSATGYLYTYPLMEKQIYAPAMQREMIGEIETTHPEFMVVVYSRDSWGRQASSDATIFKWADAYLRREYCLVATVSLPQNLSLQGVARPVVSTVSDPALLYIFQKGITCSPQEYPKLADLVAYAEAN